MSLQDELRESREGEQARRPRRRRWDLVAFVVVLVGPLAGIVVWGAARQRVGDLEDRLVRDANATFSAPHPRPVHVAAPLPGTFGEAVARHLPAIQAVAKELEKDEAGREVARAVAEGKRPPSDLPRVYAAAFERLGPDLDGLLRGTRAERADLPLPRGAFMPCDGADWTGYELAALLAGIGVRRALAAGNGSLAVSECMDGLALARDAAISGGLLPHMLGAQIVSRLVPPCAEALVASDRADLAAAIAAVRSIRDAFPSVAETLRVEFLAEEMLAVAPVIDASARSRLVPAALAHVHEGDRAMAAWERVMLRDGWRGLRGALDALLAAALTSEGAARDEALAAVSRSARRRINPLAAIALPDHARFARRMDAAVIRLDALAILAAARNHQDVSGAWPRSLSALVAAGFVTTAEAERTRGATLRCEPHALELKAPLPAGNEKDPREIVLRITQRSRDGGARVR